MKALAALIVGALAPVLGACAEVAAPAASVPGFQCSDRAGGGSAGSNIVGVRVGSAAGYDRFVVEFAGDLPGFKVLQGSSASVLEDASGRTVTLQGASSLRVVLTPSSTYGSYSGPTDFTPSYPVLREARQIGDFERVNTWGLGLSKPACFRTLTLRSPSRLVVDVQTP